jgi:hypothetical protein
MAWQENLGGCTRELRHDLTSSLGLNDLAVEGLFVCEFDF